MNTLPFASGDVPANAKWAFVTRRVERRDVSGLSDDFPQIKPGDLLLAQVERIGQHKNVQLARGRPSALNPGDHVVVAAGNRYAPDQFEGVAEISPEGCDLLAAGGIAGRMRHAHASMAAPTRLKPLGLLTGTGGKIVNLAAYGLKHTTMPEHVRVIGVFGTSMNSGKTTAAVSLAYGLRSAGFRVGGIKATGTGAFGDFNAFEDACVPVLDFTDAGMATTYQMPMTRIEQGFDCLVSAHAERGIDIVVAEFADGVFQQETAAILTNAHIRHRIDAFLFASGDAAGAIGGVEVLRRQGIEPFGVSGLVSCSPLAAEEAATALKLPVFTREQLRSAEFCRGIAHRLPLRCQPRPIKAA